MNVGMQPPKEELRRVPCYIVPFYRLAMRKLSAGAVDRKYVEIILLMTGALLLFTPFSGKPFHIDSPVTVYIAEQILVDPLNPPAGEYGPLLWPWNHTELTEKSAFRATPHPPLVSYWLALFIKVAGVDEHVVNWAFFPFYAGAILFFYLLCKQVGIRNRFNATALFAASPVLFINAQNAMYDVPLSMFCIACFYFMFRSDHVGDVVCAGIFAGLASLTKFTAGTLILSGMFYFVLHKKWKPLVLFCGAAALFNLLWMIHNLYFFHEWQLTGNGHAAYVLGDLRYRFERMISFIGADFMIPLLIVYLWIRSKSNRIAGVIVSIAALLWSALLVVVLKYSITSAGIYWICSFAGGILLVQLARFGTAEGNGKYNPIYATLLLHAFLQIAGGLFLTLYAARYSLTFIFILVIITVKTAEQALGHREYRLFMLVAVICSLLLSILLSLGDYRVVTAEKRIADDCRMRYPGRTVYFKGRLGYLYYMFHSGAKSLMGPSAVPRSGDLAVRNCLSMDDEDFFVANRDRLQLIDSLKYPLFPLRTIGGRAGFYGDDRLPFAWVGKPADRLFLIYKVK
jgi:hypothetical protein